MKCILCENQEGRAFTATPDGRRYLICGICGLVWLDESCRLSEKEEKQRYLLHNNSLQIPEYLTYLSELAIPVAGYLAQGGNGLDFGCGPVEGMKEVLQPMGYFVESYDPFFFPQQELLKNRYDFVLCSEAAEHFYAPDREFSLLNQLLKPGAILGVSSRLIPDLAAFSFWSYRRDPTHVCFYQEETVRWLGSRFGWEILEIHSPRWIFRKRSS